MTQSTTRAQRLALVLAASAAAALSLTPAAADAHDCSGFDGTCGAQFHTNGSISGGKQAGDAVTCTAGQAHASPGEPTYRVRFQRGSTPIPGASYDGPSGTYTLTDEDVGFQIACIAEAFHPKGDAIQDNGWHGPVTARPTGPCASERRGTELQDSLEGTADGDRLLGLGGPDVLQGLAGADCLDGGAGNDLLSGGSGNDRLSGGADDDDLTGGSGNDKISGGSGDDLIEDTAGTSRISAGSGNDRINALNRRTDRIDCGTGRDHVRIDRRDVVRGCERIRRG